MSGDLYAKAQRATRRIKARLERYGHFWTCDHHYSPRVDDKGKTQRPRRCGRLATVVWCRIKGQGLAFMSRCSAHERPQDPDRVLFQRVEPLEVEAWQAGRRVKRALMATGLDGPCPAPGREGKHNVYMGSGRFNEHVCRACGASSRVQI